MANAITGSTTETTPFNGPQVAVPETATTGPTEKGDQVNSYNNNINSDSSNLLAAHTTPVGEVKERESYTDSENTQKAGKAKGNSLTNETAASSSALGQASNNDKSQHAASATDPSTCDSKMFGHIDKAKKKLTNKFELKKIKAFLKKPQAKQESNKKNDN